MTLHFIGDSVRVVCLFYWPLVTSTLASPRGSVDCASRRLPELATVRLRATIG